MLRFNSFWRGEAGLLVSAGLLGLLLGVVSIGQIYMPPPMVLDLTRPQAQSTAGFYPLQGWLLAQGENGLLTVRGKGRESVATVSLSPLTMGKLTLELVLLPGGTTAAPLQVLLNDTLLGELTVQAGAAQTFQLALPTGTVRAGLNQLKFVYSEATSASEEPNDFSFRVVRVEDYQYQFPHLPCLTSSLPLDSTLVILLSGLAVPLWCLLLVWVASNLWQIDPCRGRILATAGCALGVSACAGLTALSWLDQHQLLVAWPVYPFLVGGASLTTVYASGWRNYLAMSAEAGLARIGVVVSGWLILLFDALLLLSGRYNWMTVARPYALRGYLSSAYMLVVILPTLYYLLKFFIRKTGVALTITVSVAIFFTLPYRWLGLDKWYYNLDRPTFWKVTDPAQPPPALDWFPGAWRNLQAMPYEVLFSTSLATLGLVITAIYLWRLQKSGRTDLPHQTRKAALWLALYFLILFQTWLHLSMRSPYTYFTHFKWPPENNYWYLVYLFPQAQGAVQADYVVYRDLEEHFMGIAKATNTYFIRRSLLFYVSSQLSYFFSTYYVFLVLNIALWLTACVCAYRFARSLWNEQVAIYFAFLVGCGSGFIMYAAQPMSYVAWYATVIILLFLFEAIIVGNPNRTIFHYLLFGCVLGLVAMVYETFPFYVFFLLYTYIRRLSLKRLFISLAISLGIYSGFSFLESYIPGIDLAKDTTGFLTSAAANLSQFATYSSLGELYTLTVSFFRVYFGSLGNAFFVLPVVLAICGLFLLRGRFQAALVFLLAIPSLLTVAFMHYGHLYQATQPRFVYTAYPFTYLLAAISLCELRAFLIQNRRPVLARIVPWLPLLAIFILNNVDVLGYPQMYYLFYYHAGGEW